ncbi:gamma-interferon-inducible protein 16-like isoform X17 [Leopardus geoffroyi]|uniref:gamma-interferon-inducible protein 16-like isoform X17 n=1 Tax=Leopardus geoffroyi TaxID=46844 RepID=UPI001E265F51|nr:gamma-interferon-inducible protein 16-like isoform X17 [Leopardus geoffroyi]XP_045310832.1 gamma-interferon-inducible protein 16-like isoform X17 [Leopardus geoffroyi]
METECKRILLLKGLQPLNDDQFSMVKSLLDSDLGLTPKMKEDYTKVKIADMMHKKFRGILCVNKLLTLLKDIEGLEDTVKTIKNEKRKVMNKYKTQGLAPVKKRKQEASNTDESTSTANKASRPLVSKKRKTKTTSNNKSNKTHPTPEWGQLGQPSVTGALSPASFSQPPRMPPSTPGSSFSTKKRKTKATSSDKSKTMQPTLEWGQLGQPSVTGALSPGSFSQPPRMPPPTPGSSFSTKKRKTKATSNDKSKTMQPTLEWGQLGQPSVTGALSPGSFSQPPRMPPPTPGSSFSTKKKKTQNTNTAKSEMMQPTLEWDKLGQPAVTGALSPASFSQPTRMPPPTPGSSFSTKKMETQTIKTEKFEMMQPMPEWGQLGQPSVTGALSPGSFSQPPRMPPPTPGSSFSTKKMETQTIKTEKFEMMQPMPEWGQLGQPSVTGALSPGSFSQPPRMPPPTPGSSFSTKKPRLKSVPTKASREEGLQTCAKEVMVLKATEPFAYDITGEERKMFHATVVTESQFFRVKVFNVGLKDKFIPKRVITLADYFGRNGFLEVYNVSSVSDVSADRKMEVSSRLIQNANATPKIKELRLEEPGTFVSGVYQVHKKMVLGQCITLYEIQDDTGTMDVLVYGRLTKVNCEKGDKLTLICFELSGDRRQLRSITHSFIKVIKPRKNQKQQLNPDLYMKTPA